VSSDHRIGEPAFGAALGDAVNRAVVASQGRTATTVSAAVVAADPTWEHAIRWLLTAVAVRVVGAARAIERAPELATEEGPHLLVVDGSDGIEPVRLHRCLREAHRRRLDLATVVLCGGRDSSVGDYALAAGAVRVVARDVPADLLRAVESVRLSITMGVPLERPMLTRRELEILRLVGGGRTNREVADLLWVTDQTVKYHLANVYRKLGVAGRAGALAWATDCGLAAPRVTASTDFR
jgi:DNA-binding NarL/FixJ family response regulator